MNTKQNIPKEYYALTKATIRKNTGDYIIVDYRLRNMEGAVIKRSSSTFSKRKDAVAFIDDLKAKHAEEMYAQDNPDTTMTFRTLYERYTASCISNKLSTRINSESITKSRILPFFGDMVIKDITMDTVAQWHRCFYDAEGTPIFKDTYLRSLHSRLSAILNYAVYNGWLQTNPAKMNSIGKKNADEKPVWSPEEYNKFRKAVSDDPIFFYAFDVLYFCGLRMGELLALTIGDYNPEKQELKITKSLQRLQGKDVITPPKTTKSVRTIKLAKNLCEELDEYIATLPVVRPDVRLFDITKNSLRYKLAIATKQAGLKPITIHCFRHSHITNLIAAGFSPVDIAKRVGHESIYITLHYSHAFLDIEERMTAQIDNQMEAMNTSKKKIPQA